MRLKTLLFSSEKLILFYQDQNFLLSLPLPTKTKPLPGWLPARKTEMLCRGYNMHVQTSCNGNQYSQRVIWEEGANSSRTCFPHVNEKLMRVPPTTTVFLSPCLLSRHW